MTVSKPAILFIAILAVIIFWQQCNNNKVQAKLEQLGGRKSDTTITITQESQPVQQAPPSNPQPIIITVPGQPGAQVVLPQQYSQPTTDTAELKKLVRELAAEYYAVKIYRDTVQLQDSSGKRVGVFNYNDSVTQNSIAQRRSTYKLSFPHTYTEIAVHEPYKPRTMVFAGIGINGSQAGLSSFDAGLMLKNKRDQLYGVKAGVSLDGSINYGINSYWKIKLRR